MIVSRTPLRICLGGGGTDLPSYYSINNGMVISMAINKYIYTTFKPDDFERKIKLRYSQIEVVDNPRDLKNTRARELLSMHGIGGCEINTCADLPSNTGLGSSGAFLVGMSHCIREYFNFNQTAHTLAEEACHIEINILQEPVGKQDQFIAAYGGVKIFNIDKNGMVKVSPLVIPNISALIPNMRLYYLNKKRDASEVLGDQQKLKGNTQNVLDKVKELGYDTIRLLSSGSFDEYGRLLDEYWQYKKQLSDKISLTEVDLLYEHVKTHYNVLGGKIIGAGGGGFLMLYCTTSSNEIDEFMWKSGYQRLYYDLDHDGSTILGNFLPKNDLFI